MAKKTDPPLHPKRAADPDMIFIFVGDKDLKKIQKLAWQAGWYPKRTKSGIIWMAPDEVGQATIHGTASDHHALKNAIATFRNAGLEVP